MRGEIEAEELIARLCSGCPPKGPICISAIQKVLGGEAIAMRVARNDRNDFKILPTLPTKLRPHGSYHALDAGSRVMSNDHRDIDKQSRPTGRSAIHETASIDPEP